MPGEYATHCLFDENVIGFTQAAREEFAARLRAGRPISPVTLHRWARFGVKTPLGPIRLESVFLAGRRVTSREACRRFKEAVNHAMSGHAAQGAAA